MLDDLILLRLLCARSTSEGNVTRGKASSDLRPLASDPRERVAQWREMFAAAVDRLAAAGYLTAEGRNGARLRLTDTGEQHARPVFDLLPNPEPARAGWAYWRDTFAVSKALGAKQPLSADALRAVMLLRFYLPEVDPGSAESLRGAAELLLTKKIGTKATVGALRTAAIRAWTVEGSSTLPPAETSAPSTTAPRHELPADPAEFVALVRETARQCKDGHSGSDKVFISRVWRAFMDGGRFSEGQEHAFKDRLVQANTAGTLRLIHADLADPAQADDIAASETRYLRERFHYIQLD